MITKYHTDFIVKDGIYIEYKYGTLRKTNGFGRAIKTHLNKSTTGYLQFSNRGKETLVHRYIYERFYNKIIDKGNQIDHIDGNKSNNSIKNLAEVTPGQNNRNKLSTNKNGLSKGISQGKNGGYNVIIIYENIHTILPNPMEYDLCMLSKATAEEYLNIYYDAYYAPERIEKYILDHKAFNKIVKESIKQIIKHFPIPKLIPTGIRIKNLKRVITKNLTDKVIKIINKDNLLFAKNEDSKEFNETFAWTRSLLKAINEKYTPILTRDCPYKYIAQRYTKDPESIVTFDEMEEVHEQFHELVPMYNQNMEDLRQLENHYFEIMEENNELECKNDKLSYEIYKGRNVHKNYANEEIQLLKEKAKKAEKKHCIMM